MFYCSNLIQIVWSAFFKTEKSPSTPKHEYSFRMSKINKTFKMAANINIRQNHVYQQARKIENRIYKGRKIEKIPLFFDYARIK